MSGNPKSEIRNPKQIRNAKREMLQTSGRLASSNFEFLAFDFVSDFGFRISDLVHSTFLIT
jgi:hypothetical protein